MKHGTIRNLLLPAIYALCVVIGACSLVTPGGNQNDNSSADPSLKLVAQAGSGAFTSEVAYSEEGSESRFEVTIFGGAPGAQIDVIVDGQVVATIQLDESGNAQVEFSSSPDDSGGLALPEGFVPPQAGDVVAVGDLQGTFEEDDDDDSNDNGDDDDDDDNNANDNEDDDVEDEDNDNGNDDSDDNDNSDDGNDNVDDGDDDQSNDNSDVSDDDNNNMNDNTADDDTSNDNTTDNDNTD